MLDLRCSVCDRPLGSSIYTSREGQSLTSLGRIHNGETRVFSCQGCGHLQTGIFANVDTYYDSQYDILVASEEEDQIYEIRNGKAVFRTEHQVKTLLEKLSIKYCTRLLDYGCAKSSTIRVLCKENGNIIPHAFDISERYIPFWEKFIEPSNWAINAVKNEWMSHFDVVTSFFSLEHIPAVKESVREIAGLLKPGGTFYCVVPNVLSNRADFIVVDHCNHFTASSLKNLLADAGLELCEIDTDAHRGAFVVVAKRLMRDGITRQEISPEDVERTCNEHLVIAEFWQNASARVRAYEAGLAEDARIAVYGAGFYGAFISANLEHPGRIVCYLDQNTFLHGKEFNMHPILPPGDLPSSVETILVGLNPVHAKAIISDIPVLSSRSLNYFYL